MSALAALEKEEQRSSSMVPVTVKRNAGTATRTIYLDITPSPALFPFLGCLGRRSDAAIGVVIVLMACQRARIRAAVVGDGHAVILANNIAVEIHHALAGNIGRHRSHPVRGVADGATEADLI